MSDGAHVKDGTKHPRNLRLPEVLARVGVEKTSLYGLIKKGLFPKPRKLMANSRSVGWLEEDVDNYVAGLSVQQSALPKAQVAEPAKEAVSSAPSRTLRAPAKPTKISDNPSGKPAASDDVLVPIGLEIMGRPVFLHKKSGKILLDIGRVPFPLTRNSLLETLTAR
jgi:predicted DNA-binding transcriptional regulator AlpA